MAKKPVVTRFAPSPTGALHIGGARTALFNWLYAQANGGAFLLRIEDTDLDRSNPKHTRNIIDGLRWLGLNWDDKPIKQSKRQARHHAVALQMLESGNAYKCFATQDQIDAHREKNPKDPFISPWRDNADAPTNTPFAIRLRAPQQGIISIDDEVRRNVEWKASEFNDMVLLRSDGTPTYMLAVVVDDHDMNVTHIIRGDDHLINAGRQKLIYDAMGWDCPIFAHIALIHGEDGSKLSKRHGAKSLLDYAKKGYMPEAMRNTLTRLGWSQESDDFFTSKQVIESFDLSKIKSSSAQFDEKKLDSTNAYYIKNSSHDELFDALMAYRRVKHQKTSTYYRIGLSQDLRDILPFLTDKDRGRKLPETWNNVQFAIMNRPILLDKKTKPLGISAKNILKDLTLILHSGNWDREYLMERIKWFAEMHQMKLNDIAPYLRVALSGKRTGPSIISMLCFLGIEESLARINDCINDQINDQIK